MIKKFEYKRKTKKQKTTFKQFDIIYFHPSITKELLLRCINLAKNYVDIIQDELNIILARRKSVLINNNTT